MKTLIVDDDSTSCIFLQKLLSKYGECHTVTNGRQAVEAFRSAHGDKSRYNLICMDIMMPEMDGQAALREIRSLEEAGPGLSSDAVKIIMTTALDDITNVTTAFQGLCDAYLFKPIEAAKLLDRLKALRLIP